MMTSWKPTFSSIGDVSVKTRFAPRSRCMTCRIYPCECPREPWLVSCGKCPYRGNRLAQRNMTVRNDGTEVYHESLRDYHLDRFAVRCRRCERVNKSRTRMKRTLRKLAPLCKELAHSSRPWDKYAKMVTATLPSEPLTLEQELFEYDAIFQSQLQVLRKRWNKFRRHYKNLMLAGTYVPEVTVKVNFDRSKGAWFAPKFHHHIHAVVQMPFLDHKSGRLQAFSESGKKFGLGLVHVRGKPYKVKPWDYTDHLGNYLCKYFTKDKFRACPFGKLIGYVPPVEEHGTQEIQKD